MGDKFLVAEGYPNLNNTAFSVTSILPLRSAEDLAKAFPKGDDASLAHRYYCSGGAGRLMSGGIHVPVQMPDIPAQQDAITMLLWTNDLLVEENNRIKVNSERREELKGNPLSLRTIATVDLEHLMDSTGSTIPGVQARGLLAAMEDDSLLYTDRRYRETDIFRPCDALALADQVCDYLNAKEDYITRVCHMLLASKCVGTTGSLGHRAEPDILRFAASQPGGVWEDGVVQYRGVTVEPKDGAVLLDGKVVQSLGDDGLPTFEIFGMVQERGQDGFWLKDDGTTLEVHLSQVKSGGRYMAIGCGKDPTVAGDTLATITWRMLQRSWPDVMAVLTNLLPEGRTAKLATLTLLTTKIVEPKHVKKFETMLEKEHAARHDSAEEPWFVIDGERHSLRIVNDLDLLVRPDSRSFYTTSNQ